MKTEPRSARTPKIALAIALAATALVLPRLAQAAIDGRWIAEFEKDEDRIQLTTKRGAGRHHSSNSCSYPFSAFRGLTRPASSTPTPARFELARDAGTVVFEGQLDASGGAGRFSFVPSADFKREMAGMGYSLDEEKLFTSAESPRLQQFLSQVL